MFLPSPSSVFPAPVFLFKGTSWSKMTATATVVALWGHITGRVGSGSIGRFLGRFFKQAGQVGGARSRAPDHGRIYTCEYE